MLDRPRLWALVPVKTLQHAKQRLAGVLSAEERAAFFRAMLEDVLATLRECRDLAGIALVTGDSQAKALAARYGARVLEQARDCGHTAASTFGARALADEGVPGMLQLPADIPMISPQDVDAILQVHARAPAVTLAPSRDERGSNAVACSPPDVLPLRFGDDSYFPHLDCAIALGMEPGVVHRPGLALDVDTLDDLRAFLSRPSPTRAYDYLTGSGIAKRIVDTASIQSMPP
jgi:2-phospho-L-lactate guanylyltransferase